MSWAGVTVAVLPLELAHAAAAALTALVSASPDEPMRICRSAFTVDCGVLLLLLPHAAGSKATIVPSMATRKRESGRDISTSKSGSPMGLSPSADDQIGFQQHMSGCVLVP